MSEIEKRMMEKLGLTEADFKPSEEDVTVSDLVEALEILTEIVLGGDE